MRQHTPGPWVVISGAVYAPNEKHPVARMVRDESAHRIPPTERDANARLIAAAPRMLDIITALVSSPAMVDNDEPMMQEARAILRAVEGEKS